MTDLASEPEMADDRPAGSDEPAADADFSRHEDHVVGVHSRTEARFGASTEIGIVADVDRDTRAEYGLQRPGQRHIDPAEVRCGDDDTVDVTHQSGHGDAATDHLLGRTPLLREL